MQATLAEVLIAINGDAGTSRSSHNFRNVAAAQMKAWREAADKLHASAANMAATKRAELDAAVKQMRTDASEAEARLQRMKQAGADSWSALSAARAESRKSFDRANQASWEAFKRAASPALD